MQNNVNLEWFDLCKKNIKQTSKETQETKQEVILKRAMLINKNNWKKSSPSSPSSWKCDDEKQMKFL
jgi:hypothetical protein